MRFLGVEFEIEKFDLKKCRKDMKDFNHRYPPIKGMMYNLDGELELVPGFKPKMLNGRLRVKVLKNGDFAVQESLF